MTTKHEVIAAHRQHPDWTASDIASELGCLREYIVATARRNNLTLPKVQRQYTSCGQNVYLTRSVRLALTGPAEKRGMSTSELAREIINIVARDQMVDAVLDDRVAA